MKTMYIKAFFFLGYCIFITSGQSNGELRLVANGLTNYTLTAGRVQVYLQGQWSNICNEEFGIEEANTVCHQLGYDRALEYSTASSDGFGSLPKVINNLQCDNSSLHILQCNYSITTNCTNSNDQVSVICSTTPIWSDTYNEALRLIDGVYPSQGRLEIYRSSSWHTVCRDGYADNEFRQDEADTACRQLGYTHASQYDHISGISGSGRTTNLYACCTRSEDCLSSCRCSLSRSDILNMVKKRVTTCSHTEDVTLQCDFDVSRKSDAGQRNECDFTRANSGSSNVAAGIAVGSVFGGLLLVAVFVILFIIFYFKCK